MTAIAFKHPHIVAEQMVRDGSGMMVGTEEKIVVKKVENKTLYIGLSGDCGLEEDIITYIVSDLITKETSQTLDKIKEKASSTDEKRPKAYALAVLYDHELNDIKVYAYDSNLLRSCTKAPFYADGHGYALALGAMAAGASAWEAIDAACELDGTCGYPISGFDVITGEHWEFKDKAAMALGAPRKPVDEQEANRARLGAAMAKNPDHVKPGQVWRWDGNTNEYQPASKVAAAKCSYDYPTEQLSFMWGKYDY